MFALLRMSEPHTCDVNVSELHTPNVNVSELHNLSCVTVSEPHIRYVTVM